METMKATEYARALYHAHGDRAEAEAARKVRNSTDAGRNGEAEDWRAIQRAIRTMRGPLQA